MTPEPDWTAYRASLAAMTPAEIQAEREHWRTILRVIEQLPSAAQEGHGRVVARLRLAERALQRVNP